MLVRFLSYAASVIGTRRYRPALLSCAALILVGTGAFMVFSAVSASSKDAASQIQQAKDQASTTAQDNSPQLSDMQKQNTKDTNTSVQPPDPNNNAANNSDSKPAPTNVSTPTNTSFDITISTNAIVLNQASQTASVQASTADKSNVMWSVSQDNATNSPRLEIESGRDSGSNTVIRILSENAANGVYTYTISAKDAKGAVTSKNLTVTVNL